MSYLVLARKYRPRTFGEMVGQEHVVQALTNALTQQRLHHAYMFTGTRGVGKTTVSRILAKSLNCTGADGQGGITATPCGVCPACQDIDSGRFPDYTELDAASNRGVDEVQGLLEQAVYKPVQGRFKVFMIDEVHMLTNTAFNAMLKTLEEPPEYLKFVLATTDPQKVPVTVLSRCLQFNLRPMAPETVGEHLARVLEQEGVTAEPQALRLLSRAARGSMRDALSLTDQAIAFGSGQLQEAAVRQMLGAVDRSHVFTLIDALARGDGRIVVQTVDTLREHGLSAASTLEEMSGVLQRMAVQQVVQGDAGAQADDPEALETTRLAQLLPADETQLLYSICLHGRADLGLAPDEYAALTMVLLRLLAFKSAGQAPAAEKKTLKAAEQPARSAPARAVDAPTQGVPPVPSTPLVEPASANTPDEAPPLAESAENASFKAVQEQAVAVNEDAPALPEPAPPAYSEPVDTTSAPTAESAPPVEKPRAMPQDAPAAMAAETSPPSVVRLAMRTPETLECSPETELEPEPAVVVAEPAPPSLPVRQASEPSARTAPDPAAARAGAPLVASAEGDVWQAAVQQLVDAQAIAALVRELALQSQLVARDGDHWQLRVQQTSLNQPTTRERLRAALQAAGLARQITVEVGRVSDSPALRNAQAATERQRQAEEIVRSDPYVQQLVRDFDARIVTGSIKPV
ncbi:DNA polymerase III subunit gamma/tau [Comamonas faecalis]|uniref:DNA polymerase III subunit gamma/tau n=1 Tax=Comamonas faecalis TaxID=1387849 RepID=A0ABP7RZJ2_9BURK